MPHFKRKNFKQSLRLAITGWWVAFKREKHFRVHIIIAVIVGGLAVFLRFTRNEWILLLLTMALVLITELLNTALELTIDLITKEHNIRAKLAKDVAAGAVLLSTMVAIVIGCLLFYNKLK